MNAVTRLLTEHIDIWTSADNEKKSGRGRSAVGSGSVYGIKKLRELILELAVRGKLVAQDPNDEPAAILLARLSEKVEAKSKPKKVIKSDPAHHRSDDLPTPSGWEYARLDQLCGYIQRGKGPVYDDSGSAWVVSQKCVQWGGFDITSARRISDQSLAKYDEVRFLRDGDLLWNSTGTGTVGRVAVFSNTTSASVVADSHVTVLRSGENILLFLKAFLSSPSIQERMSPEAEKPLVSGTTNQVELNTTAVKALVVPLPPLAEQHRIVAKVDELMALCDQLETQHSDAAEAHEKLVKHLLSTLTNSESAEDFAANWQRIAAHFDTLFTTESSIDALKQTILQLAVMGKLVPQDPKDEPAVQLLARIREEQRAVVSDGKIKKASKIQRPSLVATPFELPKSWTWIKVADVAELLTSGSRDWSQYLDDKGAKFVTMGNLSRGHYDLRLDTMRYVNPPVGGEGARTKLQTDDLLISITGDVGNLGRIPANFGDAYINQHTCLLRFLPSCRGRFFPEVLRTPLAVSQFTAPQRGVKNSFRLGDVGDILMPLPPLAEQNRIVAKVDELMALCDGLKSKLNATNQLQQKLADALVAHAIN